MKQQLGKDSLSVQVRLEFVQLTDYHHHDCHKVPRYSFH